jgi:hypothetical protein
LAPLSQELRSLSSSQETPHEVCGHLILIQSLLGHSLTDVPRAQCCHDRPGSASLRQRGKEIYQVVVLARVQAERKLDNDRGALGPAPGVSLT